MKFILGLHILISSLLIRFCQSHFRLRWSSNKSSDSPHQLIYLWQEERFQIKHQNSFTPLWINEAQVHAIFIKVIPYWCQKATSFESYKILLIPNYRGNLNFRRDSKPPKLEHPLKCISNFYNIWLWHYGKDYNHLNHLMS